MRFALYELSFPPLSAGSLTQAYHVAKQMSMLSTFALKATLMGLYYTGLARAMAPISQGHGVIFMLHRVGPVEDTGFSPNRILKITPAFLDSVITLVKRAGFDIVSLDEVPDRLNRTDKKRFACFTLDDGYRDNIDHAYPVFKRHNVPFTIYLPTEYADGNGDLWWLVLQESILKAQDVRVTIAGDRRVFETKTEAQKNRAFNEIYWWIRTQPEHAARRLVQEIADQAGYDASPLCSDLVMTWDEARNLARDPLVTFGGHTCRHLALAKLPAHEARREVTDGIARLEAELGRPCRHFAYPYGDAGSAGQREFDLLATLGVMTAVTTRKDHVQAHHQTKMTALPRVSLNGDYQDLRFIDVFLTGVPFMLLTCAARLKSAFVRMRRFKTTSAQRNKLPA